jgi:FixJ family two-component response regulator
MNFVPGETHSPATLRVTSPTPIVFVVDDDASVRESLEPLILGYGLDVATFATAEEFLRRPSAMVPSCLLLDIRLPDLSGFEVQGRFAAQRQQMPIVFITGYGDVPMTVRAMKAGAVGVLTKPLREDLLIATIREALGRSSDALAREAEAQTLGQRYALLSQREREVMQLVVQGLLNKQVGAHLGISEITVKAHRGRVMRKMRARSFAELISMCARLPESGGCRGIPP